jgi:hypothetical protein
MVQIEPVIQKPIKQIIKENPELYMECKNVVRMMKKEWLRDPKNAHLRRTKKSGE